MKIHTERNCEQTEAVLMSGGQRQRQLKRQRQRHWKRQRQRGPVLMVGGQVAVGKVSASSDNVHTNLLAKFSELNLNQGMQKYESRNEEVQDFWRNENSLLI